MGKIRAAAGLDNAGEVRVGALALRLALPSTERASEAGVYRVQAAAPERPAEEGLQPPPDPATAEEFSRRMASACITEGSTDGGVTWEPWDPSKDDVGALPMAVFTAILTWLGGAQKEAAAVVASFPRG